MILEKSDLIHNTKRVWSSLYRVKFRWNFEFLDQWKFGFLFVSQLWFFVINRQILEGKFQFNWYWMVKPSVDFSRLMNFHLRLQKFNVENRRHIKSWSTSYDIIPRELCNFQRNWMIFSCSPEIISDYLNDEVCKRKKISSEQSWKTFSEFSRVFSSFSSEFMFFSLELSISQIKWKYFHYFITWFVVRKTEALRVFICSTEPRGELTFYCDNFCDLLFFGLRSASRSMRWERRINDIKTIRKSLSLRLIFSASHFSFIFHVQKLKFNLERGDFIIYSLRRLNFEPSERKIRFFNPNMTQMETDCGSVSALRWGKIEKSSRFMQS